MTEKTHTEDLRLVHSYLCGNNIEDGELLFSKVFPFLEKYVYSKTNAISTLTANDKEEIISEAMICALEKIHLFNGSSSFSSFVIGIAKNKILESIRKVKKQPIPLSAITENSVDELDLFANPEIVLLRKENIKSVQQAISQLSEDHQTIIKLRLFNGMPFAQIASFMGKSSDAVDSLYRRSLQSFRKKYKEIF